VAIRPVSLLTNEISLFFIAVGFDSKRGALKMALRLMDPLLVLQAPGALEGEKSRVGREEEGGGAALRGNLENVVSLCFLTTNQTGEGEKIRGMDRVNKERRKINDSNNYDDQDESSSSNEDDELIELRCQRLVQTPGTSEGKTVRSQASDVAAALSLSGRLLGTCHASGDTLLWDLGLRRVVSEQLTPNRGAGLALRHIPQDRFLYQTRDSKGTVSLHDLSAGAEPIVRYETMSQNFCQAAPCTGNGNLVALPSVACSCVVVRDWRVPESDSPVAFFHAARGAIMDGQSIEETATMAKSDKHGMVTSLAMAEDTSPYGKAIVVCGMESGSVFFHDLSMLLQIGNRSHVRQAPTSLSLSRGSPILSLDLSPSAAILTATTSAVLTPLSAVVGIAGMAGYMEDLSEIPPSDRGRVAVFKATINDDSNCIDARMRRRIKTFDSNPSLEKIGKIGAGTCRFRPDGRIFAVGGWDKRVRVFDRSAGSSRDAPLAIMRGHTDSVQTIDWAPDAAESGLLATGSSDGTIYIWRCLS
jgi:WD40 repeat protein